MNIKNWKKNAAIFLGAQALSLFGSSLVQFAIIWHITLSTKSGVFATISILCGFLPTLLLSPFGGVWADRYNRKTLILSADAGIALTTLALALLFMAGHTEIWLLFLAISLRAFGTAIQTPAINAMLPDIAPGEKLTRVNGINSSLQSGIMLLSPLVSGALMYAARLEMIFFIDVITAAAAILVMLFFLRLEKRENSGAEKKSDYLRELREGFRYIGAERYLLNFFLFSAAFYILVAPVAFLTPLQAARNYGDDVWFLTAIEVAFSVGMMAGGAAMAIWGGRMKNRVRVMSVGCMFLGVTTLCLSLPSIPFWIYLAIMGLCGLSLPMFNTPSVVLLQSRVDPAMLGRVFGVMSMLTSSLMPLGMLVFGPLADAVRIEWLLLLTGAAIVACAALLSRNKPLLAAGKVEEGSVLPQKP